MTRSPYLRLLSLAGTALAAAAIVAPATTARAATATPTVLPTAASPLTLAPAAPKGLASQRNVTSTHLQLGLRDRLLTTGKLVYIPTTGIPFDTAYQYASGTGPGTKGDAHVSTMLAWAQKNQLLHVLPVISYFRMNGNFKGINSDPAACTYSCTVGDTAKRNLDHMNDPTFMQPYFADLVNLFQQLDANYTGQFLLHFEPDLTGYAQQLSNDPARCADDCIAGVADSPAGVKAAVASSGITQLSQFPDTMQGFYSAVLWLRDQYAPRVSLAYHVSNWATASTGRVDGKNQVANSMTLGTTPVDAVALGKRVANFAAQNGATTAAVTRPGPATSRFDAVFNDILDNDAAYFASTGHPEYWWDSENIDLPNFARWETYLGAITSTTGLPATVWQVPLGNTIYKVENNTLGHYQDNKLQYFFDHLSELKGIGVNSIIFGSSEKSTWAADNQVDLTDNSQVVCTTLGSHSHTLRCPSQNAVYTDDDGGYLRQRATAYYQSPLMLTSTTTAATTSTTTTAKVAKTRR
jgi:hypothetical protein